jgi:hypothetical protein
MCSFKYVYMWANVYTPVKFKLSALIKARRPCYIQINPNNTNSAILEDPKEQQIIQNVYTLFYYAYTLRFNCSVYSIYC